MLKKTSIRWRLTILSALLLTICCIGLTIALNYSAILLADTLDAAVLTTPATPVLPNDENAEKAHEVASVIPYENLQNAKKMFSSQSVLYMLVIILGGSALTYYISGQALKPLDKLNGQIKNLNVHNLSESLDVSPTNDEIAELTQSFNEMTNKLDNAFAMQQRFSASAAHELRTPLATLQTKVDVFKKKNSRTKSEYEELITVFEKQVKRLRAVVGSLLDLTNMEEDMAKSRVSLQDILEDIVSDLSILANDRDISLLLNCDDSTLLCNIDLLYRAFYNLIENAIKYNVDGGTVQIEASKKEKGQVEIVVKDSGIGIPLETEKYIFEPFYRGDKSRSREMGGAGLGLSFVDTIIKNHGGTISVTNNDDRGTCFTVILSSL